MEIKKLIDSNHDEILNSKNLVILKFGAKWCPPCNMLAPELIELSKENEEVLIADADVDEQETESIKQKYNVQTIPHVVFIKDGKILEEFKGYKPKVVIQEIINKYK